MTQRKLLICVRCGRSDGETHEAKRCKDCSKCFDANGQIVQARKNAAGDLLANCCKHCCVTEHGKRTIRLDIKERIEVVLAKVQMLESLLQKIRNPDYTFDRCDRLELQAMKLEARANRIRKQLLHAIDNQKRIERKAIERGVELLVLETALHSGKAITKRDVKRTVAAYIAKHLGRM